MKEVLRLLKLLSDETRLRILMILKRRELCVCQIMAVLGISQPLVSRNLALLDDAGLLKERREGKLIYYSIRDDLPSGISRLLNLLREELKDDETLTMDLDTLKDCYEYQKKSGRCDMRTFLAFMEERRKKRRDGR
jgi:ArsR family transcriptional regulator